MPTPQTQQQSTPQPPKSAAKLKALITGMIVAASALVGGLAVVLWNRKALSGLHSQSGRKPATKADDDEG